MGESREQGGSRKSLFLRMALRRRTLASEVKLDKRQQLSCCSRRTPASGVKAPPKIFVWGNEGKSPMSGGKGFQEIKYQPFSMEEPHKWGKGGESRGISIPVGGNRGRLTPGRAARMSSSAAPRERARLHTEKGQLRQRKETPRTREGHTCLWGHAGPSPSLPLRAGGEFSAGRLGGRAGYEDEDTAEDEGNPHGGGQ